MSLKCTHVSGRQKGLLGFLLSGELCRAEATYKTVSGPRCDEHVEELRTALRNPNSLGNILCGGQARTEDQIARLIVRIQ